MAEHLPEVSVVGSGPNGLTAAAILAEAGFPVRIYEKGSTPGGGCRTEALTLPGYLHDVCSTVHPMGVSSPAFTELDLINEGLEWLHASIPLAHPLDGGRCLYLEKGLDNYNDSLGSDNSRYQSLMGPFADNWDALLEDLLTPIHFPSHPLLLGRFGLHAMKSAKGLAESMFSNEETRALFAGLAAHSMLPLEAPGSAAFGLVLGASLHAVGWPIARGGSRSIVDALVKKIDRFGGSVETEKKISNPVEVQGDGPLILTMTPRQLLDFAPDRFPNGYRKSLASYKYGPGVCKVDWALREPIPWEAEACKKALTIHVGGSADEIVFSEKTVNAGKHSARPYVIVVQPTVVDPGRAPEGGHIGWAYCHVPNGSARDMTEEIESQIERFAPGFRECIEQRFVRTAVEMEAYNDCYIGGDIAAGVQNLRQTFARPVATLNPHRLPVEGWYLCSASSPPGGGVHGMCGRSAAHLLLGDNSK